jgi:hypothetical protein
MKKLIFTVLALVALANPVRVLAEDQQIICPQPYGGILLVSSLIFLVLSKKFKRISA